VTRDSWQKLRLHHRSAHDSSLPNRHCERCGEQFFSDRPRKYCSDDCRADWLSEAYTGEGHPNYDGGPTGPYGEGWNAVRERALDRDDRACILCGTDAEDLGRNPDVHHLVSVRRFVESPILTERDAHPLDNVVTLCPACHRRAEFGHVSRAELRHRAGLG
jgi:hypothetical protein